MDRQETSKSTKSEKGMDRQETAKSEKSRQASNAMSRQETAQDNSQAIDVTATALQVRQHLAAMEDDETVPKREPPMRTVDEQTGRLKILSSADSLMKWVPKLSWDYLALWCMMPIFRVRLFADRASCTEHDRAYTEHIFPDGEDLETAVLWWRKRVNQQAKGFAVFEGGFDTSGPVLLTDAPRIMVDAVSGECEADGAEDIERKRLLHVKRTQMNEKWSSKPGMSEEMLRKIENAEHIIKEKKRRGQEFMLKGGWVSKKETVASGLNLQRHNELAKKYG